MSDEQPPPPDDDGFRADRVRTLADVRRTTDDRVIAGVCAGAARYLNLDPVVLRILLVVLTFVGLAGPILYVAAWFLLPEDGADRSIAADWFNLDANEPQLRTAGLIVAAVVAVGAVVGGSTWQWHWAAWPLVAAAGVYWLFVVRPRRRRAELAAFGEQTGFEPIDLQIERYKAAKVAEQLARMETRPRRSGALALLTLSAALVAVATTWLVELSGAASDVSASTYLVVALAVLAAGCLLGTFVGHAGPLYPIGIAVAVALAVSTVVPTLEIGAERHRPTTAAGVVGDYSHGVGRLVLDLTKVSDPAALAGRTVRIDAGVGETVVIVPADLAVRVDAHLKVGQLSVFGQREEGRGNSLDIRDQTGEPLTLELDQNVGNVKVVRQ